MDDIHQRVFIEGDREDTSSILRTLTAIKEGKLANDLRLVNYFHEVPVSYPATVLCVEEDSVELLVHQHQAVVISLTKLTALKSRHFPRDVIAAVSYVNVARSKVVLNRLTFGLVRAERRMSVRVELDDQIPARFACADGETLGTLRDISVTGLAVMLAAAPSFPPCTEGELTMGLPCGTLTTPATLLKRSDLEKGCRAVFHIQPGRAEEERIFRFIMQRQVEIIRKLKDHADTCQH